MFRQKLSSYILFSMTMILSMVISNSPSLFAQATPHTNNLVHDLFLPFAVNTNSNTTVQSAAKISVENKHLVFKDMGHFESFMKSIVNQNEEKLDTVEKNLNFISMRRAENQEAEAQVELENTKNVQQPKERFVLPDPFFATALSPDGIIQIGNYVYKVTENHAFRTTLEKRDLLYKMETGIAAASQNNGIESFLAEQTIMQFGDNCYDTTGNYRLKGTSWVSNYIFFSTAGVSSKFQKKKKILWWTIWNKHDASSVSVEYNSDLTLNGVPVIPASGAVTNSNTHKAAKTLDWAVGQSYMNGQVEAAHIAIRSSTYNCSTEDSW